MLVKCKTFLQFWSVSSLLILRVRVFNNTFPSVSKNSRLLLSRGWFVLCNWNCTAQFIFTLRFLHWVILGHWPPFLFQFYRFNYLSIPCVHFAVPQGHVSELQTTCARVRQSKHVSSSLHLSPLAVPALTSPGSPAPQALLVTLDVPTFQSSS